MKKLTTTAVLTLALAGTALGQAAPKSTAAANTKAQLIALEKKSWDAWKARDAAWFEANMSPDYVLTRPISRAQAIKETVTECDVTSYSFGEIQVTMLSADAALVTYRATQQAACNSKALPAKVVATTTYVRRNGKWLQLFHLESPASE